MKIIPGDDLTIDEAEFLKAFPEKLENLNELPRIIDEATDAMGLAASNHAFSKNVLSIEITGPDRPQLTIVDLPGLIHSENKAQSRTDVEVVSQLVDSYIKNKRTIILAVVSAKNDYANQIILQRARQFDPTGDRTLGIITKPDTLHTGSDSEADFVSLAKNEDSVVHFRLGWHILRNRGYESKDFSFSERNDAEDKFFHQGVWKSFSKDVVGVKSLRVRLSGLLLNHVRKELPTVCAEITEQLRTCEEELKQMGDQRSTSMDQYAFLSKLSLNFLGLCKAGAEGSYEDPLFGGADSTSGYEKRLRAVIQNQNTAFAEKMQLRGHAKHISQSATLGELKDRQKKRPFVISENEAVAWVQEILFRSRGRELPGTYNPMIINILFQEQSQHWETEARRHIRTAWQACTKFVALMLGELTDSRISERILHFWVNGLMEERHRLAEQELQELFDDRREHAITYDHYYTENVQKKRQQRQLKSPVQALRKALTLPDHEALDIKKGYTIFPQTFLSLLSTATESNMDRFACLEILDRMKAYYKVVFLSMKFAYPAHTLQVALKTFVDNIAIQVIQRRIVRQLWEVFTPISVAAMGSGVIAKITAEPNSDQKRRAQLQFRTAKLREGLDICEASLDGFHLGI